MKRKIFLVIPFFLFIVFCSESWAQFTPEEIAQRPEWEEFLKTAEIVKSEKIGEGVTKPDRLYLKKGDVEHKAAWKNPSGLQQGYWEGWQYEIAAYRMDKLVGLNMIPVAVERELNGKKGSLSLWAENEYSLLDLMERNIPIPDFAQDQTNKMKYITRAFDSLIANEDRTQQNIRYTKDWRTILIDHSRSFRSSPEFTEKLMFGANGIKKSAEGRPWLFRQLPRAFVDRIKALTFDSIKQAVGPYLEDKEIKAILARKELLLKEIDEMIKQNGEAKVLY
jgi:hypothetical protein